jgi:hypothetical protein
MKKFAQQLVQYQLADRLAGHCLLLHSDAALHCLDYCLAQYLDCRARIG